MAIPIIQQNPATGVMADLQSLSASRTQQAIARAQNRRAQEAHDVEMPVARQQATEFLGETATSSRLAALEEALMKSREFTNPDAVAERKAKRKASTAKSSRDEVKDITGLSTDVQETSATLAAQTTPETWANDARTISQITGLQLTGDYEKDAKVRENLITGGINSIKHRQELELLDARDSGSTTSVTVPSATDFDQDTAGAVLVDAAERLPEIQELNDQGRQLFNLDVMALAKKLQAQAKSVGGMSITEATIAAIEQLRPRISKPQKQWYDSFVPGENIYRTYSPQLNSKPDDSPAPIPESSGADSSDVDGTPTTSSKFKSFDELLSAVGTVGGPTIEEAEAIAEANGW